MASAELGWQFLEAQEQNGFFETAIAKDAWMKEIVAISPKERFSAFVIGDVLPLDPGHGNILQNILNASWETIDGIFHFFQDAQLLPADADTTALGALLLFEHRVLGKDALGKICERISENCDEQGRIRVYLSPERPRLDHVVAVNAMGCYYALGREAEVCDTARWIAEMLSTGEYQNGSRYYPSPYAFLYFLNRLIQKYPRAEQQFGELLAREARERCNDGAISPLERAIRIIVGRARGVNIRTDIARLAREQNEDGSWPSCSLFLALSRGYFGSTSLTTAFALQALYP